MITKEDLEMSMAFVEGGGTFIARVGRRKNRALFFSLTRSDNADFSDADEELAVLMLLNQLSLAFPESAKALREAGLT